MAVTGKNTLSLRKRNLANEKTISVGFTKLQAWHKAAAGETGIDLLSLTFPTELTGVSNPSSSKLATAQLRKYASNVTIRSSLRGVLMRDLSYKIPNATRINWNGFTAEEGEIFEITVDHQASTELSVVDGKTIIATGELAIGATDFNTGEPFRVNANPNTQIGSVLVFRNGLLQFRNPGNTTSGGNYQEVDPGGGLGIIIRFNNAPIGQSDNIQVVSNGVVAERPNVSQLAEIEKVQGQVDAMIPTLATLAGVDETDFQAAPNNVDLKAFGDRVLLLERIFNVEIPITTPWANFTPVFTNHASVNNFVQYEWRRNGSMLEIRGGTQFTATGAAGIFFLDVPAAAGSITMKQESAAGFVTSYAIGGDGGYSIAGVRSYTGTQLAIVDNDTGSLINGNVLTNLDEVHWHVSVRIEEWDETQTIAEALGL